MFMLFLIDHRANAYEMKRNPEKKGECSPNTKVQERKQGQEEQGFLLLDKCRSLGAKSMCKARYVTRLYVNLSSLKMLQLLKIVGHFPYHIS